MTKINVIDYVDVTITNEGDTEDSCSRDSTMETHSIAGITLAKKYGDIECSFDVLPNTDYYLLYYLYGTGDSFGSDEGRIEFVGLYQDQDLADKSCDALNKSGDSGSVTIWSDEGKEYTESVNIDYFGGFEEARVESVRLQKG